MSVQHTFKKQIELAEEKIKYLRPGYGDKKKDTEEIRLFKSRSKRQIGLCDNFDARCMHTSMTVTPFINNWGFFLSQASSKIKGVRCRLPVVS